MPNSGLGTSSQTFSALGNTSQASQTNPWAPTRSSLTDILRRVNQLESGPNPAQALAPAEFANYNNAISNINALPNFGPQAAQTANNFIQTGGDPTGILRREAENLNPYASMNLDPRQTPGMQQVLQTIQNDISNQVNGQFAGAGRSLSGLNTQALARGLAQGEAVPLLNQYNQNFANMMGANQQLGNVQNSAVGNIGQGFNYAQMAPQLAALNPLMAAQIQQQANNLPFQYLANRANMVLPIAGLGGQVSGTQTTNQSGSGTATNSLLSQLAQGLGLLNPLGKFFGTF